MGLPTITLNSQSNTLSTVHTLHFIIKVRSHSYLSHTPPSLLLPSSISSLSSKTFSYSTKHLQRASLPIKILPLFLAISLLSYLPALATHTYRIPASPFSVAIFCTYRVPSSPINKMRSFAPHSSRGTLYLLRILGSLSSYSSKV